MSNIFNLLGGIAEPNKIQIVKPITRSKTSYEIRPNTHKPAGGTKSKGLSIRSNSDMNVSHNPVNVKKAIYNNIDQDALKLKVTQIDNNGRPISPGKETLPKKLIGQPIKCKEPVLQIETMIGKSTKPQKILNNDIFKKPLPLKRSIHKEFPEPESLAPYHDDQYEFDYGYIDAIEREFKDQLLKKKENIVPYEEKDFTSDSEKLISPKMQFVFSSSDEEYVELSSPELPKIPNDEEL